MKKYLHLNFIMNNLLLLIGLTAVFGAAVYRIYALNYPGLMIVLSLCALSFYVIHRYFPYRRESPPPVNKKYFFSDKKTLILSCLFLAATGAAFYALYLGRTGEPIISPWQAVPDHFFFAYGLAALFLLVLIRRGPQPILPFISVFSFLSFSAALIVYRLGYGFDPFIHRATVALIAEQGAVDPKPFYYLGQYALTIIAHKIFLLPINLADKLLVPLLSALTLPYFLSRFLSAYLSDRKTVLTAVLLLLILPCSIFIVTTPQNLAYLFLLLAVLVGLCCKNQYELALVYVLALAALATHPIAGIPALIFAFTLTVYHGELRNRIKKTAYALLGLAAACALPLAFYFVEKSQGAAAPPEQAIQGLNGLLALFRPAVPGTENFILNFLYLAGQNIALLIFLPMAAGVIIALRHLKKCRVMGLCLLLSAGLAAAYLLTGLLPFGFLIEYERSDYSNRLLITAALFGLPFWLLALSRLIEGLKPHSARIKYPFAVFAVILVTAGLYLSYPRFDRYHNSHLYAVSEADIAAVRWIEENAAADYIVLANQQVSAAALREFGFKKYYQSQIPNLKSQIFYYPVPTGGPLYQHYLDMVYEEPSRENILKAMDLAGVNEGYFVLNKYWWAFPKILAEARLSADSYEMFDKGAVYVFNYNK